MGRRRCCECGCPTCDDASGCCAACDPGSIRCPYCDSFFDDWPTSLVSFRFMFDSTVEYSDYSNAVVCAITLNQVDLPLEFASNPLTNICDDDDGPCNNLWQGLPQPTVTDCGTVSGTDAATGDPCSCDEFTLGFRILANQGISSTNCSVVQIELAGVPSANCFGSCRNNRPGARFHLGSGCTPLTQNYQGFVHVSGDSCGNCLGPVGSTSSRGVGDAPSIEAGLTGTIDFSYTTSLRFATAVFAASACPSPLMGPDGGGNEAVAGGAVEAMRRPVQSLRAWRSARMAREAMEVAA